MAAVAALVAALLRITGGRLPGLPRSVGGWAAALGFHGGLTSVLGLYLVFWVDLTILQAPSHAAPPLHVPQPAGMPAACTNWPHVSLSHCRSLPVWLLSGGGWRPRDKAVSESVMTGSGGMCRCCRT